MGKINLMVYLQHENNKTLGGIQEWTQAKDNNIVYGGRSMLDPLAKLRVLFDIFKGYNISIQLTKFYLNYPNIALLGQ